MSGRVYLDANIFIAMLEHNDERAALLLRLLGRDFGAMETRPFVTSRLTLAECLVHPMRHGDGRLADGYARWLDSAAVHTVEIDRDVLVRAAGLRAADPRLKLPDAIHLATARVAGCERLLTDDRRLNGTTAKIPVTLRPEAEILHSLIAEFSA